MGFADDLCAGLAARPRHLAPKWFYDAEGSRLFERICETPEYYPTRTELALLDRHAPEIARLAGPGVEIVEPGAGASRKVRVLLSALEAPARFVPVDISGEHLEASAEQLRRDHPGLDVRPLVADFTQPLVLPPARGRRVGFYPGSSIGNFDPPQAEALLRRFAGWLEGGPLLVGVDLVKDPGVLHAAYNDAEGVTAAFNLNLLARANREAGADFDLGAWAHAAFYHPALQRIEMHLVSRRAQRVRVGGRRFEFDEGESIHTENSYKYTVAGFQALARRAGFEPGAVWVDGGRRFSLHWLVQRQGAVMKAIWNGTVIAESDDTVVVEGNHYFPASAVDPKYLLPSNTKSMCPWKGEARYHTVFVDGDANPDAAWYYPEPKDAAANIRGRIAFWKGVKVSE